ncbi:helicase HerA domain-containing protein [Halorubrum sp. DTA98]|uniref:helicase HerA domain-containing protein n=1 Tax=Halorubrum sp. DTA98 TaxID=3402163 RepID=UPI003AB0C753
MTDEETIHVADVSDGIGGDATAEAGSSVELPVVDVLTGRSFITGKSGSGKSNTASVVIENLLSNSFPVMIVDTDGEYYGLKEEFEILHVGADDECDIVVSPEHAEKIASLALEQNVPIILDVSGYLEESVANELLLNVVKQLFAKEKKLKKPFLLVVEECHEYIPEGGGMDETGKMLIKVGKRGRKHGLGIVGISQRPADVKKDFITQCDWLCWHRLTWDNDTKVVGRILGSKYADAVEELDDGEAFLMTDWDESIRRIQFHRKRTFDAGATPGLDDFERPELKSVSGDLVNELESISDEQARHESELADLRQELDQKRSRINQLERELEDARDLSNMADQFAQALLGKAEAPYRGGSGRTLSDPNDRGQAGLDDYDEAVDRVDTTAAGAADGTTEAIPTTASDDDGDDGDGGDADAERDAKANRRGPDAPDRTEDDRDPDADVDPVTRADVAEGALRFDDAMELGTRAAVIDELRGRIESLPDLSRAMLRHYRREGVSEPIAAHIDAGGDGDSGHAYSRHRPIRKAGLIRHAGRGHYAYAVPDLIRDAYADRLDDDAVRKMVREVETTFVPPAERTYAPSAEPSEIDEVGVGSDATDSDATDSDAGTDGPDVAHAESSEPTDDTDRADGNTDRADGETIGKRDGLSEAARRLADRGIGPSNPGNSDDAAPRDGPGSKGSASGGSDQADDDSISSLVIDPDDDAEILDEE